MKKSIFLAFAATSLLITSCGSCSNNKQQGIVLETETDSIFMPNDSTVADLQTFVYEGLMPMDNGTIADYTLTIKSLGWDENGTYTILSTVTSDTTTIKQHCHYRHTQRQHHRHLPTNLGQQQPAHTSDGKGRQCTCKNQ